MINTFGKMGHFVNPQDLNIKNVYDSPEMLCAILQMALATLGVGLKFIYGKICVPRWTFAFLENGEPYDSSFEYGLEFLMGFALLICLSMKSRVCFLIWIWITCGLTIFSLFELHSASIPLSNRNAWIHNLISAALNSTFHFVQVKIIWDYLMEEFYKEKKPEIKFIHLTLIEA